MNQEFSCMLMIQRGVFEALVTNTIVNASLPQLSMEEEVLWCGEPFLAAGTGELLHCEKSFNALEYRIILQKGLLLPIAQLKCCFLKRNNQMFNFNKTVLLPTLQRP